MLIDHMEIKIHCKNKNCSSCNPGVFEKIRHFINDTSVLATYQGSKESAFMCISNWNEKNRNMAINLVLPVISHEFMHHLLLREESKETCTSYDNISVIEKWLFNTFESNTLTKSCKVSINNIIKRLFKKWRMRTCQ